LSKIFLKKVKSLLLHSSPIFSPFIVAFMSGDSDDEDEDRENLIGDIEDSGLNF
jgi:hypothetical protein